MTCLSDLSYANYFKKAIPQKPKCIHFEAFINLKLECVHQKGHWHHWKKSKKSEEVGASSAHISLVYSSRSQPEGAAESPGVVIRPEGWAWPRVSGALYLGWDLRSGINYKFPGDADAASWRSTVWESWRKSRIWVHSALIAHRGSFCCGKNWTRWQLRSSASMVDNSWQALVRVTIHSLSGKYTVQKFCPFATPPMCFWPCTVQDIYLVPHSTSIY